MRRRKNKGVTFKHLISKYLTLKNKLKLSQQIFYGFLLIIGLVVLLFVFNAFAMMEMGHSVTQLVEAKNQLNAIQQFSNNTKIAQLHARFVKRLVLGQIPLELTEENQLLMIPAMLEVDLPVINRLLETTDPENHPIFQQYMEELASATAQWEADKSIANLLAFISQIDNTRLFAVRIIDDLTLRFDENINKIERRRTVTLLTSLIANLLIIGFILILFLPFLREIKKAFLPLHQASDSSLKGAERSLQSATQINDSIKQLQGVLQEMVLGITDVSSGAQQSSLLSTSIIQSVKTAVQLVDDLAQKSSQTHDSLMTYQDNLKLKIAEIQLFINSVNNALDIVQSNTNVAEQLGSQLTMLDNNMNQISAILVSVSEITDLTNLLALNASIEAARAGEHGRGFDVVAERIRDMSEQTKKLTSDIKKTVLNIKNVSSDVGSSLNTVISSVRASAQEVSQITVELTQLEEMFQSLYHSNETIIEAANIQLQSTKEIHRQNTDIMTAIENISAQTQNVSAAMEELSASSEEINAQIETIGTMVSDTQQVIEKQVKLVELAKQTTEKI